MAISQGNVHIRSLPRPFLGEHPFTSFQHLLEHLELEFTRCCQIWWCFFPGISHDFTGLQGADLPVTSHQRFPPGGYGSSEGHGGTPAAERRWCIEQCLRYGSVPSVGDVGQRTWPSSWKWFNGGWICLMQMSHKFSIIYRRIVRGLWTGFNHLKS